ncbi:Outer membrane lipoprotein carrier protein LolA [Marinobacterium lacunae]|uniref:Outer-membrane lipoprotein carrier protein n=1 Tax=Marinobacterium lacunae TaxID=1232683 RepID=A0A081FZD1_9GAMM|nr:outer membrane lipoprotein chaperone LolA [Marinobacterium lacunae]KEA63886.1 Outer membrane lipoprotein carrier protein LolA [Marinobacterium lacunae]
MSNYFKGAMIGALFSISTALHAAAVDRLSELLTRHKSFGAEFEQYTLSEEGARQEHSTGEFVLERPDRFDWRTHTPYEQRIVSDGHYIWVYDPDLEQVTRKPADDQSESAPALILNGKVDALSTRFDIRQIEEAGNREVFELLPMTDQRSFERIRLLFKDEVLSELLLEDSLGQRTAILLNGIELDANPDPKRFTFTPPEGVDLILDPGV